MDLAIIHKGEVHKLVSCEDAKNICSTCSLTGVCNDFYRDNNERFPCNLIDENLDKHFEKVNILINDK